MTNCLRRCFPAGDSVLQSAHPSSFLAPSMAGDPFPLLWRGCSLSPGGPSSLPPLERVGRVTRLQTAIFLASVTTDARLPTTVLLSWAHPMPSSLRLWGTSIHGRHNPPLMRLLRPPARLLRPPMSNLQSFTFNPPHPPSRSLIPGLLKQAGQDRQPLAGGHGRLWRARGRALFPSGSKGYLSVHLSNGEEGDGLKSPTGCTRSCPSSLDLPRSPPGPPPEEGPCPLCPLPTRGFFLPRKKAGGRSRIFAVSLRKAGCQSTQMFH